MDLFNKKRVRQLEAELKSMTAKYNEAFKNLNIARQVSSSNFSRPNQVFVRMQPSRTYMNPANRQVTQNIKVYADVVVYAKELQKNQTERRCGGGGCQTYYKIPAYQIDSVANATPLEKKNNEDSSRH
jgi:hypothetical protein